MAAPLTVVKIGGSLLTDRLRLRALLTALAEGKEGRCVIVPGGGPFAEAVRVSQAAAGFDDALAHRLALDAMGRMAEVFAAIEPRLSIARTVEACGAGAIWDPVALRIGHPDIAETWAVTSDSLSLWLATTLLADRCILEKSIDRPAGASNADLARLGLVDAAFPGFADAYPGTIIIRGPSFADKRAAA
ncbi:MAG: uridylate kinase [Methylobacterium sp.]|uniref:amino acid kinase family protein n=1 Tax=Methylobacterium sp. TaxID=409 RepID=UPI0025F9E940|nr:uridylate kinase [Methylobacterium sp.]MBX9933715.1 uridylate kinase [Methylobacterium sp.]